MSRRLLKIFVVFGRSETPYNSLYFTLGGILPDRKITSLLLLVPYCLLLAKTAKIGNKYFFIFPSLIVEPISNRHTNYHGIKNQQLKIKGFVMSVCKTFVSPRKLNVCMHRGLSITGAAELQPSHKF
jgi:hypothetical protein